MLRNLKLAQIARRPTIISNGAIRPTYADSAALRVTCVRDLAELEIYAPDWNQLVTISSEFMPTTSYPFIRSFLEHELSPADRWCCLFAFAGPQLVGVLPVVASGDPFLGYFHKLHTPANDHVLSVTILAASGHETQVISRFLQELNSQEPRYFNLSFKRTHEAAPIFSACSAIARKCWVVSRTNGACSYLPIEGTFSCYFSTLHSKLRHNLARRERKLAAMGEVLMRTLSNCQVTDDIFEEFLRIEASGWKGHRGSAILSSPKRAKFYRSLMQRLRSSGWLEMHLLTVGGRIIAANFGMKIGSSLVLWKVGYDEAFATFGPGILLLKNIVERAFNSGDIREINFVTEIPMEKDWHLQHRRYFDLSLFPKGPASLLFGVLPKRAIEKLRHVSVLRLAARKTKAALLTLP